MESWTVSRLFIAPKVLIKCEIRNIEISWWPVSYRRRSQVLLFVTKNYFPGKSENNLDVFEAF